MWQWLYWISYEQCARPLLRRSVRTVAQPGGARGRHDELPPRRLASQRLCAAAQRPRRWASLSAFSSPPVCLRAPRHDSPPPFFLPAPPPRPAGIWSALMINQFQGAEFDDFCRETGANSTIEAASSLLPANMRSQAQALGVLFQSARRAPRRPGGFSPPFLHPPALPAPGPAPSPPSSRGRRRRRPLLRRLGDVLPALLVGFISGGTQLGTCPLSRLPARALTAPSIPAAPPAPRRLGLRAHPRRQRPRGFRPLGPVQVARRGVRRRVVSLRGAVLLRRGVPREARAALRGAACGGKAAGGGSQARRLRVGWKADDDGAMTRASAPRTRSTGLCSSSELGTARFNSSRGTLGTAVCENDRELPRRGAPACQWAIAGWQCRGRRPVLNRQLFSYHLSS